MKIEEMPRTHFSFVSRGLSAQRARELVESGARLLTADGVPVVVLMSLEEWTGLQGIPENQRPIIRRIGGQLWYKLPG